MDNNNIFLDKLTPSAKEALDEIIIKLRIEIIKKANSIAQMENTGDKEISLRDIMNANAELHKAKLINEKIDYRRKRIVTIISLSGALYTIFGIFLYLYQNQSLTLKNNIGLFMALAGVLIILMGFMYTQILFRRKELFKHEQEISSINTDSDFDLVERWQIIETLTSKLMKMKGFAENESNSVGNIIAFLSYEFNDKELFSELKELLQIRNKILHEDFKLDKKEKQDLLKNSDKIISLLEDRGKNARNANKGA